MGIQFNRFISRLKWFAFGIFLLALDGSCGLSIWNTHSRNAGLQNNGKTAIATVGSYSLKTQRYFRTSKILYVHTLTYDNHEGNLALPSPVPKGTQVNVFYDTTNPSAVILDESRNELGYSWWEWLLNLFYLTFFSLAGIGCIWLAFSRDGGYEENAASAWRTPKKRGQAGV